jgi:hypothetical protein
MNFRTGRIADQDADLKTIVDEMVKQKRDSWSTTQVVPNDWPGPTILPAA